MSGEGASTSYAVLPVRLRKGAPFLRHLYLKAHAGADSLTKDRTLFVTGLPAQMGEGDLLALFSRFGSVERAAVHASRVSAVVLYEAAEGRDKALRRAAKGQPVEVELQQPAAPHGLKGWVEQHKGEKPGNAALQQQLDDWMEGWEVEEQRRREEALRSHEEEGWTVVQRHKGRKKNDSGTGITVGGVAAAAAEAAAQAAAATAKKAAVHSNFYRFQQRERRANELLDLRSRFEEDKRRIAELKAARRFKPY